MKDIPVPAKVALMIGQSLLKHYDTQLEADSSRFFSSRKNAVQNVKYFHFRGDKTIYHQQVGINPAKHLRTQLGIDKVQVKAMTSLGSTEQARLTNFEYLAYLCIYSPTYLNKLAVAGKEYVDSARNPNARQQSLS